MKIKDFKGIGRKTNIEFVKATNVFEDYYEIELKKPKNMTWEAGMHGIFTLPKKKINGKKFRGFSIASVPGENNILLGTRSGVNMSNFKKELLHMKQGEIVSLRGPFGWFTIRDETSPLVFIALGVGITPIRALLLSLDNQTSREVNLVYSANRNFMFKEMIDQIVNRNDHMNAKYVDTLEDTKAAYLKLALKHKNEAYYYISGHPKGINSIKKVLRKEGIKKTRIINDPFLGY